MILRFYHWLVAGLLSYTLQLSVYASCWSTCKRETNSKIYNGVDFCSNNCFCLNPSYSFQYFIKYFNCELESTDIFLQNTEKNDKKKFVNYTDDEYFYIDDRFYSSVWCSNSAISGMKCNFKNLCYNTIKKEFIFIENPASIIYGIENLTELSKYLFTSSVKNHNAFQIRLSTINSVYNYKYKKKLLKSSFLLFSRFKPDNIQHIIHDDLLPIYFTLQELTVGEQNIFDHLRIIIIDQQGKLDFDFMYEIYGTKLIYLSEFEKKNWVCFSKAHVGLNKISIWHNYKFQGVMIENEPISYISYHHIDNFKNIFIKSLDIRPNYPLVSKIYKIIILDRKSTRKILNVDDVSQLIHKFIEGKAGPSIVRVMYLEDHGVNGLIAELVTTNMLIGMHGAGLILAIFMPKNSMLVELWPYGFHEPVVEVYKNLANLMQLNYVFWCNEDLENSLVHPEYPIYYGGIETWNSLSVSELLTNVEHSHSHDLNCCDNPEWLFKIYQDSVINVYSEANFKSKLLQDVLNNSLVSYNTGGFISHSNLATCDRPVSNVNNQCLSQIDNVKCQLYQDKMFSKLQIMWNWPWNYEELDCTEISFGIFLKSNKFNNYQNFSTTELHFFKKFSYSIDSVDVWITSFCDSGEGATFFIKC